MKAHRLRAAVGRSARLVSFFSSLALGGVAARGEAPAPSPSDQSKTHTHTLFMGIEISVAEKDELYRVRDVSGGSFVIDVKGRPVFVPMNSMFGAPINMRVEQKLQLSKLSATITGLRGERAYTPGNDPGRILAEQQAATQSALIDQRNKAALDVTNAESGGGSLGIATKPTLDARNPALWTKDSAAAKAMPKDMALNYARESSRQAERAMNSVTETFAKRLSDELALELYDAMSVDFVVTSDTPLNNPYVVLITRYHERDAKPGHVQNWIYAKSLEPIGSEPQKVRVLQGGFPRGYVLEEYQVHLYNLGHEVASNVAPKRVPLTASDAMLYLMIDYLAEHKHDTLPATVALTTLPADYTTSLSKRAATQLLFVKVSADGHITDAFKDEGCSEKVNDAELRSALPEIRYKPALEKGKPVESVVRLKLADLPREL